MVNALTGVGTFSAVVPPPFTPGSIAGAVAFWDFNDAASLTLNTGRISAVADQTGNGNNATNGGSFTTCPGPFASGGFNNRGYALFNGSATLLRIPSLTFASGNTFSIAGRVYGAAQTNKMILAWGTGANPFVQLGTGNSDNTKVRGVADDAGAGNITVESTVTAFDSAWHTIAISYDGPGNTMHVYVDTVDTTGTGSNPALADANDLVMGARDSASPSNYFGGNVEYLAVYNGVLLSPTDLTNLQNYGA